MLAAMVAVVEDKSCLDFILKSNLSVPLVKTLCVFIHAGDTAVSSKA
jgi:hypothetical protein